MSEAVDFVPNEATGALVTSAARLENGHNIAGDREKHVRDDDEELSCEPCGEEEIPSDLLEPYYCGVGPFHPRWLQFFANKKFFTLLLCFFSFVQGSLVSGELVYIII